MIMKKERLKKEVKKSKNIQLRKYGCYVCGLDSWCGTDGCPMDPQ